MTIKYGIGKTSDLPLIQYSVDIFACFGPYFGPFVILGSGRKQDTTFSGAIGELN